MIHICVGVCVYVCASYKASHMKRTNNNPMTTISPVVAPISSRYENQKRRDWNTFCQYLQTHRPAPVSPMACSGSHVIEFLQYLDQFGKTKVHNPGCPFFGLFSPPAPCPCPLRQAWGSLDALVGRLRAAYEEHGGGLPETNPFAARSVRNFLRELRNFQAQSRGVSYEKKRKKVTATGETTLPLQVAGEAAEATQGAESHATRH